MTEVLLSVGEPKIRQFEKKPLMAAIAELVWNALDANATKVTVQLHRSELAAIYRVTIVDNGHGITPDQARDSFKEYGASWKSERTHSAGNLRILHGKNGEGRLYALALGENLTWDSVALVDGRRMRTVIRGSRSRPTHWIIDDPEETDRDLGTTVTVDVPQGKRLRPLESDDAAHNLAARLAFYLLAYRDVKVEYDGSILDPEALIESTTDLDVELPPDYLTDPNPPVLTFVEWKARGAEQKLLLCSADGIALTEYGDSWNDSVVSFTPYLRWARFDSRSVAEIHMLEMEHAALLHATEKAIRRHLARRRAAISSEIIDKLQDEGIYPYDLDDPSPTKQLERQTFDLVVTVARSALPPKGAPRKLSVGLIQAALERDPADLHGVLERALSLEDHERRRLAQLLAHTPLSNIISAASTVVDRLSFVGGLRKILSDPELRKEFREVDQLHPMVAQNLWLFGEEWSLARTEVGLTNVLAEHLDHFDGDIELEGRLDAVKTEEGRAGRVDILLYRNIGDERDNERLVVELKRPTVKVGRKEVQQVMDYARALVESPNLRGSKMRRPWQFILVTWDYDDRILRDIRQKDKPEGLADDQDDYQVWVKSWGEIFDQAERKLHLFRKQLDFEASDDVVTAYLQQSHNELLPDRLKRSSASRRAVPRQGTPS